MRHFKQGEGTIQEPIQVNCPYCEMSNRIEDACSGETDILCEQCQKVFRIKIDIYISELTSWAGKRQGV